MHSITNRQTDGQQDNALIADHIVQQYDRLKINYGQLVDFKMAIAISSHVKNLFVSAVRPLVTDVNDLC